MNKESEIAMAIEIGKLKAVLGTLITWIAQSAVGVISVTDAQTLLKSMDSVTEQEVAAELNRTK